MLVAVLPVHQHFVDIVEHGGILLLHLGVLHIAVAYKMVALLAGRFGSGAVEALLPCIHALADMYSAVVDEGRLYHLVAGGLEDLGNRCSEEVVPHMAEVEGLVGIGRGELDHDGLACRRQRPEFRIRCNALERLEPVLSAKADIEETLHHIVRRNLRAICLEVLSDCHAGCFGCLMRSLKQGEHHQGVIPFEVLARRSNLERFSREIRSVQSLHGL